jgi:hypothetical protein
MCVRLSFVQFKQGCKASFWWPYLHLPCQLGTSRHARSRLHILELLNTYYSNRVYNLCAMIVVVLLVPRMSFHPSNGEFLRFDGMGNVLIAFHFYLSGI